MYEFMADIEGRLHVFVVLFKYEDSETTLAVVGLGHREMKRDDG